MTEMAKKCEGRQVPQNEFISQTSCGWQGFQTPPLIWAQKLWSDPPLKNFDPLILGWGSQWGRLGSLSGQCSAGDKTELGAWSMFRQVSVLRPRAARSTVFGPHSYQSVSSWQSYSLSFSLLVIFNSCGARDWFSKSVDSSRLSDFLPLQ